MAKKMKINFDGTEVTYRRLYWGERKKLKAEGLFDDPSRTDDAIEAVLQLVVEPKEIIDNLDMDEVNKIWTYALGFGDAEQEKN